MRATDEEPRQEADHSADELTARELQARARPYVSFRERTGRSRAEEYFSLKNSLLAMGIGALLCWWDTRGGVGHMVLRFLSSLTHEMGHASFATVFGAPSFPVIRLDGHAAAVHRGQITLLALAIQAFLVYMAFAMHRERRPWKVFAGLAAGYPLIAFTGLWELLFLLAGHLGELAFAGVFFWRAWTGGFTHSLQERYLYASVAWYLAVRNLVFHFQLMTSAAHRTHYHGSGSFGLVNDYIRVANDVGCSLGFVAFGMFVVNVVVLPVVVWLCIRGVSDAPAAASAD